MSKPIAYQHLTPTLTTKLYMKTTGHDFTRISISSREQEVLHLIAQEYSTKEIGEILYISYETAHTHRKNLLRKLNAKNAAGLIRIAFERGLLSI